MTADSPRNLAETRDALLALPHPFRRAEVHALVGRLRTREGELDPYLNFSERGYTRTLFYGGPRFEILVLCWRDGQASPIHDHAESVCSMAVVRGSCSATNYRIAGERTPAGPGGTGTVSIEATGSEVYRPGQVVTVARADIHRIANLQGDGSDLITVHFYLPPILTMRCFDDRTGRCETIRPETLLPRPPAAAGGSAPSLR